MSLRTVLSAVTLVVACGFVANQAHASSVHFSYNFVCYRCGPFIGNQAANLFVNAQGVLTTTDAPVNGALTITGITGDRTTNWFMSEYSPTPITSAITGLIPADPSNPFDLVAPPDNLLYPARDPKLDFQGFAYTLTCCSGSYWNNIAQITGQFPGVYAELGPFGTSGVGTFTLTPVPEPMPLAIIVLAGLAMLVSKRTWRSRNPAKL